jgi:hypothetical protein
MIGLFKSNMTMSMRARETPKTWLDLLQPAVETHHGQAAEGSTLRRAETDDGNFQKYISERRSVEDATLSYNTESTGIRTFNGVEWGQRLFRFKVGERVLLSRIPTSGIMDKQSLKGRYFDNLVCLVTNAALRVCSSRDALVPGIHNTLKLLFFCHVSFLDFF